MPGNYTVEEEPPAGYLDGKDSVGSVGGTLCAAGRHHEYLDHGHQRPDYNFGELLPASISGMVHVDMNGDCIYEPGEPLLAGVTDPIVGIRSNQVIATTTTDQNGQYKFNNLSPFATYTVHEVQPAGLLRVWR